MSLCWLPAGPARLDCRRRDRWTAAAKGPSRTEQSGERSPEERCLHREGRNPTRGQEPRVPRGDHAGGRQRVHPQRPPGLRRVRRRGRLQHQRRRVRRRRRQDPGHRRRGVGHRRAGAQGQGADRRGVPPDARGAGALHLPAPGRLQGVHRRADRPQGHRHRVRDRRAARPVAAAARPDVRGGRPARPAGGRVPPAAAPAAGAASCWAASPACTRPRPWSSAPASPA